MATFWRVHPGDRPFGDWDATSAPFYVTEPFTTSDGISGERSRERRPGDPVQQGYSCFDNPWHLYLYVGLQWGSVSGNSTVLSFPGNRVGTGHDGEPLVVPTGLPRKTDWGGLCEDLPNHPLPPTPAFAPWVPQWCKSWEALAKRWAYLDQGLPEQEFIVRKFGYEPGQDTRFGSKIASLPPGYTIEVQEQERTDRWGLPNMDVRVKYEGRTVGSLSVFQRLHEGDAKPVGHPNIYVDEEHQRRGLATAMYAEVQRRWPHVPIVHSEHASDAAKALNRTLPRYARQQFALPPKSDGPILRNWKGYSQESQQRILATYDDLVAGRIRPEPKQRPPLVGFWTAQISGADRIIVDDLPGGGWVLLGAVFEHNYELAERQIAGWLAWRQRTASGPLTIYRAEHRPPDADLSQPESIGVHWTTRAIDYGYQHEPGWKRVVWQATVEPEAIEDASDRFNEGEVVVRNGAVVHLTGRTERMKGPYVDVQAGQPEHPMNLDVVVKGTRIASKTASLPEGITFEYIPDRGTEGRGVVGPGAMIVAKIDGQEIGALAWYTTFVAGPMGHQAGMIEGIYVSEQYQRRGIASEMLSRAREIEPRVHHSKSLTDDGRAWSQAVGSKTSTYIPMSTRDLSIQIAPVRKVARPLSLDEATALTRRVLRAAGFPQADEAVAERHPSGFGKSSVAWYMDTIPPIPVVALAQDMQNELTVLHECAHILRNGPGAAGKNSGQLGYAVHDPEFFRVFLRLMRQYASPECLKRFETIFGTRDFMAAKTAAGAGRWYHIADKADFRLNPKKEPALNRTLPTTLKPGIFLTQDPQRWGGDYGYRRPFIVEFDVPAEAVNGGIAGTNELYVPAEFYDRLRIVKVHTWDGFIRDQWRSEGPVEGMTGINHVTGEPLVVTGRQPMSMDPAYAYPGPGVDARQIPADRLRQYVSDFKKWRRGQPKGFMVSSSRSDLVLVTRGDPMGDEHIWEARSGGTLAGYLTYNDSAYPRIRIKAIEVNPEFQRQGVATWLLQQLLREYDVDDIDPGQFTDAGAALWTKVTGRPASGTTQMTLPNNRDGWRYASVSIPGLVIEEEWDLPSIGPGQRAVSARINGKLVGGLLWTVADGIIDYVQVDADQRRQGIATALLEAARRLDPNVRHDVEENRSDLGKEWVRAVGSKTAAQSGVYYHVSGESNRTSIEQQGLLAGDHGLWLYSDPERVRGIGKVWTPGHPFEQQDVWEVRPTNVVHGTEARDQTSADEWYPDDPIWVTYEDVPPSRVRRVDNQSLASKTAAQPGVYYHVTAYRNWPAIRAQGLRPGSDGHVWLFTEMDAAMRFKDAWGGSDWSTTSPTEWKVPPCIIVVRTDRAVPTEAGVPGAYWVEGEVTEGEVFDVVRPADLHHYASRRTAALPTGLYWRTHDQGRPFGPEDATSQKLTTSFDDSDRVLRGYSCLEDPWDLWVYILAFGWMKTFIANDEVVAFTGKRQRLRGTDGEPLVIPDMQTVRRFSWPEFERLLLETPRPAKPGGPGARHGYYDNWYSVGNAAISFKDRSPVAAELWSETAEWAGVKTAFRMHSHVIDVVDRYVHYIEKGYDEDTARTYAAHHQMSAKAERYAPERAKALIQQVMDDYGQGKRIFAILFEADLGDDFMDAGSYSMTQGRNHIFRIKTRNAFTILHECAHAVAGMEAGHGQQFRIVFRDMLRKYARNGEAAGNEFFNNLYVLGNEIKKGTHLKEPRNPHLW